MTVGTPSVSVPSRSHFVICQGLSVQYLRSAGSELNGAGTENLVPAFQICINCGRQKTKTMTVSCDKCSSEPKKKSGTLSGGDAIWSVDDAWEPPSRLGREAASSWGRRDAQEETCALGDPAGAQGARSNGRRQGRGSRVVHPQKLSWRGVKAEPLCFGCSGDRHRNSRACPWARLPTHWPRDRHKQESAGQIGAQFNVELASMETGSLCPGHPSPHGEQVTDSKGQNQETAGVRRRGGEGGESFLPSEVALTRLCPVSWNAARGRSSLGRRNWNLI